MSHIVLNIRIIANFVANDINFKCHICMENNIDAFTSTYLIQLFWCVKKCLPLHPHVAFYHSNLVSNDNNCACVYCSETRGGSSYPILLYTVFGAPRG